MSKSYQELIHLNTLEDRFEYLKLNGQVCADTFGFDRYLNQKLYTSQEWKRARDVVIARDQGCEMGLREYPIAGKVIVHHLNPITREDILERRPSLFDPDGLISVSHDVHNAITYGDKNLLPKPPIQRTQNDTCPWKNKSSR